MLAQTPFKSHQVRKGLILGCITHFLTDTHYPLTKVNSFPNNNSQLLNSNSNFPNICALILRLREMSLRPKALIISLIWFLLLNITLSLLCKRSALLNNRCKDLHILDLMISEAYIFKISILFLWRSSFVQFIGAFPLIALIVPLLYNP